MCATEQQAGGREARSYAAVEEEKKEKKRTKWEPTEIEAPVVADELQRVHQLTTAQCLYRGYFHNVERQGEREQHCATGRGHLSDLQNKTEQTNKNKFNTRN